MKNKKTLANTFFVCSILCYIVSAALSLFLPEPNFSFACMMLGFSFLGLGIMMTAKAKKEEKPSDKDETDKTE